MAKTDNPKNGENEKKEPVFAPKKGIFATLTDIGKKLEKWDDDLRKSEVEAREREEKSRAEKEKNVPTIRAKENINTVYYFFDQGIVRLTTYSNKLFWAVFFIVSLFLIAFFNISGAFAGATQGVMYGPIVGALVTFVLEISVSSHKIEKWDTLSFDLIKKEKGAESITWSEVKSAIFGKSANLKISVGEKNYRMKVMTDHNDAEKMIKSKLS